MKQRLLQGARTSLGRLGEGAWVPGQLRRERRGQGLKEGGREGGKEVAACCWPRGTLKQDGGFGRDEQETKGGRVPFYPLPKKSTQSGKHQGFSGAPRVVKGWGYGAGQQAEEDGTRTEAATSIWHILEVKHHPCHRSPWVSASSRRL